MQSNIRWLLEILGKSGKGKTGGGQASCSREEGAELINEICHVIPKPHGFLGIILGKRLKLASFWGVSEFPLGDRVRTL